LLWFLEMESLKLLALAGLQTTVLPISASQVARITGVSHWHPVYVYF
jgi:hypothetical protein